jgi:hypothetical protein
MIDVIGSDGEVWYRIDAPILGTIRDCHKARTAPKRRATKVKRPQN